MQPDGTDPLTGTHPSFDRAEFEGRLKRLRARLVRPMQQVEADVAPGRLERLPDLAGIGLHRVTAPCWASWPGCAR